MRGRRNYENQYKGNQIVTWLMNEYDKFPYSIQYLADYDSFFSFGKEGRTPITLLCPQLDPPLEIIFFNLTVRLFYICIDTPSLKAGVKYVSSNTYGFTTGTTVEDWFNSPGFK